MFDFFAALFGGLYYASRMTYENSKSSAYDRSLENVNRSREVIQRRYEAEFQHRQLCKEVVLDGNHYDEICRKFQKEFEFVFGSHWRDMLDIPPKPSQVDTNYIIPPGTYTADWVYHLMLADDGKMDDWVFFEGLPAGGIDTAYRNMKFVQCIENRLVSKGVEGVKFVFKPFDSKRTVSTCSPQSIARTIAGGHFIIEATAFDVSNTIRLW